jgi:hypothetical protein
MGNSKIFMFGLNQENYKKSGIYQIRNTVNGKFYIGSAIDFSKRFCVHYNRLINNKHGNIKSVIQYDLDGKELNTFKSIADAVIFLRDSGFKISTSKISLCISGKRNKAGGFVWKEYYPISSLTLT